MKPIEPGCRALIINAVHKENIGKMVTAITTVAPGEPITLSDGAYAVNIDPYPVWLVEGDLIVGWGENLMRSPQAFIEERNLMRLDNNFDDELDDETSPIEEEIEA